MTLSDVIVFSWPMKMVYWLHKTEVILNNAHRTIALQRCYRAAFRATARILHRLLSLRGIEARASMARGRLTLHEVVKASGTFDLHGFFLLVQHVIFRNFLSTIC